MVAYGFPGLEVRHDLEIAQRLGVSLLEILPDWRTLPDPKLLRKQVSDAGLFIHGAHGCWGGQSILAPRVDLAALDPSGHAASVEDIKHCIDWLSDAGGRSLVVHPGGLSVPGDFNARRDALARSLIYLADHARGTGVLICVENMPPGVHPGSRMADIFSLLDELDRPGIALTLDTGHANITATAGSETLAAGRRLASTHVHDNDGRQDIHHPPGYGTIDWVDWVESLDRIGYEGVVMLECIRHLRRHPETITPELLERLKLLTH
jgi:sugar phosphate isomerase/epimerase